MLFGGLFYAVSVASEARCGQLCGRKNVSAYDVICFCSEQQNLREAIIVCIVALTLRKVNRFAGFSQHRICDGIIKEKRPLAAICIMAATLVEHALVTIRLRAFVLDLFRTK